MSTVLASGVFDMLHIGHVRYLEEAKRLGDELVVSVTTDRWASKAPNRPVFPAAQRAEMLASLKCVDRVVLSDEPTAVGIIEKLKPDIYVKGRDYAQGEGRIAEEIEAVQHYGGRVHFTDTLVTSSSALINRHLENPDVASCLDRARSLEYSRKIPELVEKISPLRMLFIGETILDEYIHVSPLGKPPKEFILACHEKQREDFAGGVVAASRHARNFVAHVEHISARTVRKTRYVDADYTRKLFECYQGDLHPISKKVEEGLIEHIWRRAPEADVVVVTDFGHGMITPKVRDTILEHSKWLAVNAQSNAANLGYNTIRKYESAGYACLDAPEARLAVGDPHLSAEDAARALRWSKLHGLIVTDGTRGCVVSPEWKRIPAFAGKAVDTMGAGDAFLAVTAALAKATDDMELVGFIGNIVGAIKVGIVGHRQSVDKATVLRYAATLLK